MKWYLKVQGRKMVPSGSEFNTNMKERSRRSRRSKRTSSVFNRIIAAGHQINSDPERRQPQPHLKSLYF